jgi:hypothetical protein
MALKAFFRNDRLFGEIISDEEFEAMTADQLRDTIYSSGCGVFRNPDGHLVVINVYPEYGPVLTIRDDEKQIA